MGPEPSKASQDPCSPPHCGQGERIWPGSCSLVLITVAMGQAASLRWGLIAILGGVGCTLFQPGKANHDPCSLGAQCGRPDGAMGVKGLDVNRPQTMAHPLPWAYKENQGPSRGNIKSEVLARGSRSTVFHLCAKHLYVSRRKEAILHTSQRGLSAAHFLGLQWQPNSWVCSHGDQMLQQQGGEKASLFQRH